MVNNEGLILLHKTGHKSGRKHDYDIIYKHNHPITPVQVENVFVYLGYFGELQNDFPTVKSVLPVKKKKNSIIFPMKKELTTENILN